MSDQKPPSSRADKAEPFTLAGLSALLRRHGSRVTPTREAILRALLDADGPLSLEEIRSEAARQVDGSDAPDFGTVFRTMARLEELKLVRKVNLGRASSYYELTDSHHYRDHLVCTDCGQVTPLQGVFPVERVERKIAREHGFTQLTHSLEFFGRCGECSSSSETA